MALLERIDAGEIELIEPPHFIAEVSAVLARKSPQRAMADLGNLLAIPFRTLGDSLVHASAVELALRFNYHLFGTLYHAVAIQTPETRLVTADLRYLRKANDAKRVLALADAGRWLH